MVTLQTIKNYRMKKIYAYLKKYFDDVAIPIFKIIWLMINFLTACVFVFFIVAIGEDVVGVVVKILKNLF